MDPIRTLIADDEPLSRQRLRRMLGHEADIDIVAECATGAEVVQALETTRPELLFLDIRMPEGDGFSVVEHLPVDQRPKIVFVTAHEEHALRAFDVAATDYLLKPLSQLRLRECMQRLREHFALQGTRVAGHIDHVMVQYGYRQIRLPVEQIDMVGAQGNYIELHTAERSYLLREPLHRFSEQLDPARFARVHRSWLVRIDAIRDLETLRDGSVLIRLHSGQRLRSGRAYGRTLRQRLRHQH